MTKYQQEYQSKLITVDEALSKVKSNDEIIVGLGAAAPRKFLDTLHTIANKVENVTVCSCLPLGGSAWFTDPGMLGHFCHEGWFFTPPMRKVHATKGLVSFIPNHLHIAGNQRLNYRKPSIYIGMCTPPDKHGNVSLSTSVTYELEMIENADIVILEVSDKYPFTFGDSIIPISKVDYFYESNVEVGEIPYVPFTEKDKIIGDYISELVEDGSTIQLGIGGIPNAVAQGLLNKKDLAIHTEMFTDGMVDLFEAGVITSKYKTLLPGKMVCTFALGTKKLYDFIDMNPNVALMQGSWTNDPYVVGQNYKMVSINTTLEMDLGGQCCSESIGNKQFSGTGGQADTATGAKRSKGGKSIIALYSTAKDDTISKIVPMLTQGAVVSLQRNDVDYVVTEYGVVNLFGCPISERVKRLISVAHPKFRPWLEEEAAKNQIW